VSGTTPAPVQVHTPANLVWMSVPDNVGVFGTEFPGCRYRLVSLGLEHDVGKAFSEVPVYVLVVPDESVFGTVPHSK
jgi:hypothetical protein